MSATRSSSAGTTRRAVALALATLGAVIAVLVPTVALAHEHHPPLPLATSIDITSISTPSVVVPSTAGAPSVYVVKATDFSVGLAFRNGPTPAPLSYTHATDVTVKVLSGPDSGMSWIRSVSAGATTATLNGLQFIHDGNGAVLQVSAVADFPSGDDDADHLVAAVGNPISSAPSSPFTVLLTSTPAFKNAPLTSVSATGSSSSECVATPSSPVCADLLPGGAAKGDGLLSLAACDSFESCTGLSVQVLIPLKTPADIRKAPATLVVHCDKTQCRGGAIKKYRLDVILTPGTPAQQAPNCPAKGIVGPDQTFCVDYVQSHRENAGDTLLYLLFVDDAKIRFP